jgi:hypothetical protein
MGVVPHAGQQIKGQDVTMRENNDPELKRLREVAVAMLGAEKGNLLANLVGEISCKVGGGANLGPVPSWARNYDDKRHLLRWDSS